VRPKRAFALVLFAIPVALSYILLCFGRSGSLRRIRKISHCYQRVIARSLFRMISEILGTGHLLVRLAWPVDSAVWITRKKGACAAA
jgi:hypothetical protein